tara:strand:- start:527 stop:859 length:333 start_codon:yes stop_codon:yes gene_type:complete
MSLLNVVWLETFQPKTSPAVSFPLWSNPIDLGPVVDFSHARLNGQIAIAQAYPPGTGDTVSERVEWVMDTAQGAFRFGIAGEQGERRLMLQLCLISDYFALTKRFPEVAR